ncbi:MAG: hypothetical protein ACRDN6_02985 [Gaiellaceae bacterium]
MERAVTLWERYSRDRTARWIGLASLPAVWLSIAWVDARFLVFIPLIALLIVGGTRIRERFWPRPDEPEEYL